MRVPEGWINACARVRGGGDARALLFLAERAGPDGLVRGYTKAAIGHASGVNERQARNQTKALETPTKDRPAAIEVVAVFCPQQTANDYYVLVPWVAKARASARFAREIGAENTIEAPCLPVPAADASALVDLDPDPPPRKRTSTYNASTAADYWRELNKTRW